MSPDPSSTMTVSQSVVLIPNAKEGMGPGVSLLKTTHSDESFMSSHRNDQ